jgi:hypothetical protein
MRDPTQLTPVQNEMPMPPQQVAGPGQLARKAAQAVKEKIVDPVVNKAQEEFGHLGRDGNSPADINHRVSGVGEQTPEEAQQVVDNTQLGRVVDPARQPHRNFSLDYIQTTDDILAVMDDAALQTGEIGELSTIHQSNAETIEIAGKGDLSIDGFLKRKPGNWTAAQLTAGRTALVRGAEEIYAMAQVVQDNPGDIKKAYAFRKMLATHSAMQRTIEGAVNEAGRVLQSMQIIIGSDTVSVPAMTQKMAELDGGVGGMMSQGSTSKIASVILESGGDPTVVSRASDELWGKRAADAAIEFWINGLLSGPQTHAVNLVGNTGTVVMGVTERYMATGFGKARKFLNDKSGGKIGWDGDSSTWTESNAMMIGMIDGFSQMHIAFARGLRDGEGVSRDLLAPGAVKTDLGYKPSFTADKLGLDPNSAFGAMLDGFGQYYVRLPGRVLGAEDEVFKTTAYLMESNRYAVSAALSEGQVPGTPEYKAMVSNILQGEDPVHSLPANDAAVLFAKYQTFTNEISDNITLGATKLTQNPFIKLYVPFVRVVANLMKYGLERSPISPLVNQKWRNEWNAGGATRDLAATKLGMGAATSAVVWGAMANTEIDEKGNEISRPLITGNGPKSRADQKIWQQMGIRPWSVYMQVDDPKGALDADGNIKQVGKYMPINRLDPVGQIIGQTAVAFELMNGIYGEAEREEAIFAIAAGLGEYLTDKTYFQGFSNLLETFSGQRKLSSSVAQLGGSIVPTWINTIKKVQDRDENDGYYIRETRGHDFLSTLNKKLTNRVPWLSDDLQPKINVFGQEVILDDMGWWKHSMSPIQYSMVKTDDVVANELFEQGYGWMEPTSQLTVDLDGDRSVKIDLFAADHTGELFREYSKAIGQAQYKAIKTLIYDKDYKNLKEGSDTEDVGRVWKLRSEAQKARRAATKAFKAKERWTLMLQNEALKQLRSANGGRNALPETGEPITVSPET